MTWLMRAEPPVPARAALYHQSDAPGLKYAQAAGPLHSGNPSPGLSDGFRRATARVRKYECPVSYHVSAEQAEAFGGGEEVVVVGVNLFETVFLGAGQMDGVACTELHRLRKARVDLAHSRNHDRRERQPLEGACVTFLVKLPEQSVQIPGIEGPFPEPAVESGQGLGASEQAAGHMVRGGHLTDSPPAGIFEVQADDVAGVEVDQEARPSRSSEITCVLSVPPRNMPRRMSLRKAGETTRREK